LTSAGTGTSSRANRWSLAFRPTVKIRRQLLPVALQAEEAAPALHLQALQVQVQVHHLQAAPIPRRVVRAPHRTQALHQVRGAAPAQMCATGMVRYGRFVKIKTAAGAGKTTRAVLAKIRVKTSGA